MTIKISLLTVHTSLISITIKSTKSNNIVPGTVKPVLITRCHALKSTSQTTEILTSERAVWWRLTDLTVAQTSQ